jgi:alkylation response protein AidB-like acyl-CoA dehydrogenase
MRFLERERATLAKFLPGLDEALAETPRAELERSGGPGLGHFRAAGGAGLIVPNEHGGAAATPLEAVRVQRAIGSRSPSLAVATTMHHFSMASLVVLSETSNGFEWMLMEALARGGKLLASGFAEGRPDGHILQPTLDAVPVENGIRVSGVKQPCSLAHSMDMLTASVLLPRSEGAGREGAGDQLAVAMIPADSPGITIEPFWGSFALAGAESDKVVLSDVFVQDDLVVRTEVPPGEQLDALQVAGFLWFELLMSASYLGAASALVEWAFEDTRIAAIERVRLVGELEGAMAAIENVARQLAFERDTRLLGDCLLVRYAVQDAIGRVAPRAAEALGGLRFISSDDVAYLVAASQGLNFHPPSRLKMAASLADYLSGEAFVVR